MTVNNNDNKKINQSELKRQRAREVYRMFKKDLESLIGKADAKDIMENGIKIEGKFPEYTVTVKPNAKWKITGNIYTIKHATCKEDARAAVLKDVIIYIYRNMKKNSSHMKDPYFNCRNCDKVTRNTGENADVLLCTDCNEEALAENNHNDYHTEPVDGCKLCEENKTQKTTYSDTISHLSIIMSIHIKNFELAKKKKAKPPVSRRLIDCYRAVIKDLERKQKAASGSD